MGRTPQPIIPPRSPKRASERCVDEIKQSYIEGLITIEEFEVDLEFAIAGGVYAGSYLNATRKRAEFKERALAEDAQREIDDPIEYALGPPGKIGDKQLRAVVDEDGDVIGYIS